MEDIRHEHGRLAFCAMKNIITDIAFQAYALAILVFGANAEREHFQATSPGALLLAIVVYFSYLFWNHRNIFVLRKTPHSVWRSEMSEKKLDHLVNADGIHELERTFWSFVIAPFVLIFVVIPGFYFGVAAA